jgi:hypothetical protein
MNRHNAPARRQCVMGVTLALPLSLSRLLRLSLNNKRPLTLHDQKEKNRVHAVFIALLWAREVKSACPPSIQRSLRTLGGAPQLIQDRRIWS